MQFIPPCPAPGDAQIPAVIQPCSITNEPIELDLHHEKREDFGCARSYRYITVDSGASQSNVKTGTGGFLMGGWWADESPSGYVVTGTPNADSATVDLAPGAAGYYLLASAEPSSDPETVDMVPPDPDLVKAAERALARCVRALWAS
jgi:hypothetical protein